MPSPEDSSSASARSLICFALPSSPRSFGLGQRASASAAGNLFIGQCRAVLTADNLLLYLSCSSSLLLLSLFAVDGRFYCRVTVAAADFAPLLLPTPNLPATFDAAGSSVQAS